MILSTLHKTTGATHDLYSLRETIDFFFPLHKSENALSLPRGPIIFIGIYLKTTAQGYSYKIFGALIHYTEAREAQRFGGRTQILPWLQRRLRRIVGFFYYVSGPQDKPFCLDRAYTLIDAIGSKF